jgi:acyl-CoA reductase-like NAD-dependent aldehyde dehydrogenase
MRRVRERKIGPGTDPEAEMGPLVTVQHLNRVRSYVELGVDEADSNWLTTVVHEFPLHRLE